MVARLTIAEDARYHERPIDEDSAFEPFFCPTCGSTIYAPAGKHPAMIGVAVGTIANPEFQSLVRSVWEQTMHRWIAVPEDMQHFLKGRG